MVNHISGDQVDFRALSRAATRLSLGEEQKGKGLTSRPPRSSTLSTELSSTPADAVSQVDSDWMGQDISIDYEKTVAEVYNEFAQKAIENSQDLSVTHHNQITYPQGRLPGLASWAPDWTLRQRQQIIPISRSRDTDWLLDGLQFVHTYVREHSILGVLGNPLTRIKNRSQVIDLHNMDFSSVRGLDNWSFNSLTKNAGQLRATEKHIMLYRAIYERWRKELGYEVLLPLVERKISDYYRDSETHFTDTGKETHILWALGFVEKDASTEALSVADYLVKAPRNQSERSIIQGRRVAVLDNGLTALVPACAEKGDFIFATNLHPALVLLRGHKGPNDTSAESSMRSHFNAALTSRPASKTRWLRRPQSELLPVRHYTFIGDCFVDPKGPFPSKEEQEIRRDYHIAALH
jgi:hypothetical protein